MRAILFPLLCGSLLLQSCFTSESHFVQNPIDVPKDTMPAIVKQDPSGLCGIKPVQGGNFAGMAAGAKWEFQYNELLSNVVYITTEGNWSFELGKADSSGRVEIQSSRRTTSKFSPEYSYTTEIDTAYSCLQSSNAISCVGLPVPLFLHGDSLPAEPVDTIRVEEKVHCVFRIEGSGTPSDDPFNGPPTPYFSKAYIANVALWWHVNGNSGRHSRWHQQFRLIRYSAPGIEFTPPPMGYLPHRWIASLGTTSVK